MGDQSACHAGGQSLAASRERAGFKAKDPGLGIRAKPSCIVICISALDGELYIFSGSPVKLQTLRKIEAIRSFVEPADG